MKPVRIVGGGLAGLSLGLALQRRGVAVVIHDAGDYPRHRVCGEFITGLDEDTRATLGLGPFLSDALSHQEVAWFRHDEALRNQTLPSPALALSRHCLDERLADAFTAAGGELRARSRVTITASPEGTLFAHGRRRTTSTWLGLKVHARHLPLVAGLELHLGDRAYVGLCRIEDNAVNVSGLFVRRPGLEVSRADALPAYLRAAGLAALADRLDASQIDPESRCAVAGLGFSPMPQRTERMVLGDAFVMIPPFTGNGMAMAFQSAALALPLVHDWAKGEMGWKDAVVQLDRALRSRFRLRLASARALHPLLVRPTAQRWVAAAGRSGLLPLRTLYRALH